jgi:ubiquinone/menaquinone biosynthesis C-methylase UbiE
MKPDDATALLAAAVPRGGATWADLGAGSGTFTRALATRLGPGGRIYAVDRDAHALAALQRWADRQGETEVIPVRADFTRLPALPGFGGVPLDGILLANALHSVARPDAVLRRLAGLVRPGGRVVIAEYDDRAANPWVPYPIPARALAGLAQAAGLTAPVVTATRPSTFGGTLYVAYAERL